MWASYILWILCEIAIAACDLAELLGTILGLNLLFGVPLLWGALVYSDEVDDEHARDDEQYLSEIAEEIRPSGIVVEIALAYGDPSRELAAFVASHNVEMLVMGSHGHRLLGDLLWGEPVGSTRQRVNIPVLVVSRRCPKPHSAPTMISTLPHGMCLAVICLPGYKGVSRTHRISTPDRAGRLRPE